MRFLLDTHIFLWSAVAGRRISDRVRAALADRSSEVFVSAASAWEITIKYTLGRLPLPSPPSNYLPTQMRILGFTDLPVTHVHATSIDGLPVLHRDPFDRLLIAQAQAEGLTLVSADDLVLQYPIKTIDARI